MVTSQPVVPPIQIDLRGLADFKPDFSKDRDAIIAELTRAFLDAYMHLHPTAVETVPLKARAAAFALERSGELIKDITETTREGVAELVASSVESGLSPGQLRAALMDYSGFGKQRAGLIARTESAIALGAGERAAALDMGQDEKKWIGGECEECATNAGDGWVGMDEAFSSGDDGIPAHPACTCDVIYRTARVHQESVAVARCPSCRRKIGEAVNRGARLPCPRCKEIVEVT